MPDKEQKKLTLDVINGYIRKLESALDIAKIELKNGTDSYALARQIHIVKALLDELAVIRQIKNEMGDSSAAEK